VHVLESGRSVDHLGAARSSDGGRHRRRPAGEQLAHIVAQIEMIDDELAGRTRQRIGSAVEPHAAAGADGSAPPPAGDAVAERREQRRRAALRERRGQLESLRAEAARFADSLRAERARRLRTVSELRRRSALAVVRAADATLPD
jgi:hypothetical protein